MNDGRKLTIVRHAKSSWRFPGMDDFRGRSFHTARWDYEYTGGGIHGGLTGLADKVVAVVGAGASGIQCIPHLAASAKKVFVFQRTPSAIGVRLFTFLSSRTSRGIPDRYRPHP